MDALDVEETDALAKAIACPAFRRILRTGRWRLNEADEAALWTAIRLIGAASTG